MEVNVRIRPYHESEVRKVQVLSIYVNTDGDKYSRDAMIEEDHFFPLLASAFDEAYRTIIEEVSKQRILRDEEEKVRLKGQLEEVEGNLEDLVQDLADIIERIEEDEDPGLDEIKDKLALHIESKKKKSGG